MLSHPTNEPLVALGARAVSPPLPFERRSQRVDDLVHLLRCEESRNVPGGEQVVEEDEETLVGDLHVN